MKYRIVKLLPDEYPNNYAIQVLVEGQFWQELSHSLFKTLYNDFESAEYTVLKILELDKWNATHGKYQVLKEYE